MTAEWYEAKVAANRKVGDDLTALDLDVTGTSLARDHALPGQYGMLQLEGVGQSYFAIASPPNRRGDLLEFLIKGGSALGDALARAPVGSSVRVSKPMGRGFPLERAHGRNVLLVATGSGISPIRSLIEIIRNDRASFKDVTLYFGARTPSAFAYADEQAAWERDGVRVVRTVSRPTEPSWSGLTGYVQSHLPGKNLDDSVAYVCGQREMVAAVRSALVASGMPDEHVFLNF